MPELIEVEAYRRLAATVVGRAVGRVAARDAWYLKGDTTAASLRATLVGRTVTAARRHGKLLLIDTTGGHTLGLRFGMTGRLIVDGATAVDRLEYGSNRTVPAWNRFGLAFVGGGSLVVHDPRRLGGAELEPDAGRLGPDAASVTPAALRAVLAHSATPLKARLLDQERIAGLGNLLVDETLWRARLDPARPAGSLSPVEQRRLHRHVVGTVADLSTRGGSHTGDLQVARGRGTSCPRCGAPLQRRTIGGRTTYSCPAEQR